jgi:cobalt/nickel transport system permease protein
MARRARLGLFVLVALGASLVLAFVVSPFASSAPDGLEKVAADEQLDSGVTPHALEDGPLADYAVDGVDDERLSTGIAGVIGVLVTLVVATGAFLLIRAFRPARTLPPAATSSPNPSAG